jgi:hypothetical protein
VADLDAAVGLFHAEVVAVGVLGEGERAGGQAEGQRSGVSFMISLCCFENAAASMPDFSWLR